MNIRTGFLVALISPFIASAYAAKPASADEKWFDACAKAGGYSNPAMYQCQAELSEKHERAFQDAYNSALSAKTPAEQSVFRKEQAAWDTKSQAGCKREAQDQGGGGSSEGLIFASCLLDAQKLRTKILLATGTRSSGGTTLVKSAGAPAPAQTSVTIDDLVKNNLGDATPRSLIGKSVTVQAVRFFDLGFAVAKTKEVSFVCESGDKRLTGKKPKPATFQGILSKPQGWDGSTVWYMKDCQFAA